MATIKVWRIINGKRKAKEALLGLFDNKREIGGL